MNRLAGLCWHKRANDDNPCMQLLLLFMLVSACLGGYSNFNGLTGLVKALVRAGKPMCCFCPKQNCYRVAIGLLCRVHTRCSSSG